MIDAWPEEDLAQALEALARAAGIPVRGDGCAAAARLGGGDLRPWLRAEGERIGVDIDDVACRQDELAAVLRERAPLLGAIGGEESPRYLAILRVGRRRAVLVTPAGRRTVSTGELLRLLGPLDEDLLAEGRAVAGLAGLAPAARERAAAGLAWSRQRARPVTGLHALALPPEAPLSAHLRHHRIRARAVRWLALYGLAYLLWIVSWWFLARALGAPARAPGWIAGWLLTLASAWTVRLAAMHRGGLLTLELGGIFRQRALAGAVSLPDGELRSRGIGDLLGRILELGAAQSDGLKGLFNVAIGTLELCGALAALAFFGGAHWHALLLAAWIGVALLCARRYLATQRRWTGVRIELARRQIENLVGHTSSVVQRDPAARSAEDDRALADYLHVSKALDRRALVLVNLIPRGWLLVAALGLAPLVLGGAGANAIAVALGGGLLAFRAFRPFAEGMALVVEAVTSWSSVAPLVKARPPEKPPASPGLPEPAALRVPIVRAVELTCSAPDRVLVANTTFTIDPGSRILLEGPSGSGKSTLARILAGLEPPARGAVLARGKDLASLGLAGWRNVVAYACQFGRNHVFTGSLAFNVLLARGWPATPRDLAEAESICRALELGPLLDRMPNGIHTIVGEIGWQLSHGERSRLFLARALLQDARLLVLDESLAPLDPETKRRVTRFLERRHEAIIAIEHP